MACSLMSPRPLFALVPANARTLVQFKSSGNSSEQRNGRDVTKTPTDYKGDRYAIQKNVLCVRPHTECCCGRSGLGRDCCDCHDTSQRAVRAWTTVQHHR